MGRWGVAAAAAAAVHQCSWMRAWSAGCWGSHQASSPCRRSAAPPEHADSGRVAMTDTYQVSSILRHDDTTAAYRSSDSFAGDVECSIV